MTAVSKAPPKGLTCCLCARPVPKSQDVYPLDDEWERRYPGMQGRLACHRCALGDRHAWQCWPRPAGHIDPAPRAGRPAPECIDHWSHVGPPHTHAAAVAAFPRYAAMQGAAGYMRWWLDRPGRLDAAARAAWSDALARVPRPGQ